MQQLNSLIKDASNQFQCHNFQTSLSLYIRSIDKCIEQKLPKYILYNLKSSQAALRTIFGEYQTALSILNEVLIDDKQHWLSLIRRSQIYKKVPISITQQNKYKKAMKDLDILTMYAPDNMQVAALKLEIKGFMANINASTSSQSESDNQDLTQEQQNLKFSNLRKIDRTSVSIMLPNSRKSRVTISGDQAFFYQSQDPQSEPLHQQKIYTPSFNCSRYIEIDKQLQQQNKYQQKQPAIVLVNSKQQRTKSILKNRNSTIYRRQNNPNQTMNSSQKLLSKVKNIDGHMISHEITSNKSFSSKSVQFRKSIFSNDPPIIIQNIQQVTKKKPQQRKSCLKRPSLQQHNDQPQKKQIKPLRKSKFQSLGRSSIDGKLIKSDRKKKQSQPIKQNEKQNIQNNSDNQSQQGSHYNIFGSKKVILNKQLRQNLGLQSDSVVQQNEQKQKKSKQKQRGSILKTSSIAIKKISIKKKDNLFFKQHQQQDKKLKPQRKNKKSVMFISC